MQCDRKDLNFCPFWSQQVKIRCCVQPDAAVEILITMRRFTLQMFGAAIDLKIRAASSQLKKMIS